MSEGRKQSAMDRSRAASAQRDAMKAKPADELSAELQRMTQTPVPRPRVRNRPECPDCPPSSFSRMTWDGHRGLWVHTGPLACGGTWTVEELQEEDET